MKTLFHPKWYSYNEKASKLDEEVRAVIEPIIKKWIADGYNPREMESIILSTMSMTICVEHMKKNAKLMMEEREKKK